VEMTGPNSPDGKSTMNQQGWLRRLWDLVRWAEPYDGPLFANRAQARTYLIAWLCFFAYVVIWLVIAFGLWTGWQAKVSNGVFSLASTVLLVWMVIAVHQRLKISHGGTTRHIVAAWWMGPWDSVGRVVWLPVRLGEAWRVSLHGVPDSDSPRDPAPL
jgi:hypothetical protein